MALPHPTACFSTGRCLVADTTDTLRASGSGEHFVRMVTGGAASTFECEYLIGRLSAGFCSQDDACLTLRTGVIDTDIITIADFIGSSGRVSQEHEIGAYTGYGKYY